MNNIKRDQEDSERLSVLFFLFVAECFQGEELAKCFSRLIQLL